MEKKLQAQQPNKEVTDAILGGTVGNFVNDSRYEKSKSIETVDEETITIENPITHKKAVVVLNRRGTTADKLGSIMLAPDATREQKNAMVAMYLFEQGKESASFITDLMVYKGTHTKEMRAFKSQMRFDFEMLADRLIHVFQDIGRDIKETIHVTEVEDGQETKKFYAFKENADLPKLMFGISDRLAQCASVIVQQRKALVDARQREKGYGIYIDKSGKPYSVFDEDLDEIIKEDREAFAKAMKDDD